MSHHQGPPAKAAAAASVHQRDEGINRNERETIEMDIKFFYSRRRLDRYVSGILFILRLAPNDS